MNTTAGGAAPGGPTFFLGVPPRWARDIDVPVMVSADPLMRVKRRGEAFPKARCLWALDSAGFSHIGKRGEFELDPDEYGGLVYRLMVDFGAPPLFCSIQDWMTEDAITRRTGFTLIQHQDFTVESYLYLTSNYPHAPWMPVLQGQEVNDYLRHAAMYEQAGIDLASLDRVGVGSVCRRQGTRDTGTILAALAARSYRLHGFGVKVQGLRQHGHHLVSADSYAWSVGARRRRIRLPQCTHRAADCRNCRDFALQWRTRVLAAMAEPRQLSLL